jgi:hypothetical protein
MAKSAFLSLSQAAGVTGKSKSVLFKALKEWKLSHQGKDERGYKIESSELFRVFGKNRENCTEIKFLKQQNAPQIDLENTIRIRELELRLEMERQEKAIFREQVRKIEQERDDWKQQAQTLLLQQMTKGAEEEKTKKKLGLF